MSSFEYRLPDVGEGLDAAEIITWHVSVGDAVVPDQVLADVETDKSVVEVPSPVEGAIAELTGAPGDLIDVGAVFAIITVADDAAYESAPASPPPPDEGDPYATMAAPEAETTATSSQDGGGDESSSAGAGDGGAPVTPRRVLASPATRRLALGLGVDLASVRGSGPVGRVTKDDVQRHVDDAGSSYAGSEPAVDDDPTSAATGPTPPESRETTVTPLRGLRRQIAKNMVASWTSVPHITDFREVDATALVAARRTVNAHLADSGRDEKITFLPFLVRAVSIALATSPKFNASLDMEGEEITYFGPRNIGLAVSTDAGLFVPVLKNSQATSLVGISQASEALADRARNRTITSEEMSDGTFTITNYGSYGGWLGTPIIRPPEAAIAGFGRIEDRVVAVDGAPAVKPILPLAVSADHRLIDGADMGVFLRTLTNLLEDPVRMMAEDF